MSRSIESQINSCSIEPGLNSDHSLISLTFMNLKSEPRGKGTWKFNNSLLKDDKYVSRIKALIHNIKSSELFEDKCMLWEYMKCQIRTDTMLYAGIKAKLNKKVEKELLGQLTDMEKKLDYNNEHKYYTLKKQWEKLQAEKNSGIILRLKAKFVEEGEKNTKYFLNLEKRNYNTKYMKSILSDNGRVLNDPKAILEEQASYYQTLYTSKKDKPLATEKIEEAFLQNKDIAKLNNDQKLLLETPLSLEELSKALSTMANDKSPGLDGFTTNFYKFFWIDIKVNLYESYKHSLTQGQLCGQRRGLLSLIPKKEKDLRYLKSWRPVSLLATDYKILAKALASRLHKAISDLVSSDQVGYIKGRFIGENVRVIDDLIISSKTNNVPGLLVLIDFEKAFDTVEWDFLFKTLKVLNFGPSFISWIRLLYTNITSCTMNNGHLSRNFGLSRGI